MAYGIPNDELESLPKARYSAYCCGRVNGFDGLHRLAAAGTEIPNLRCSIDCCPSGRLLVVSSKAQVSCRYVSALEEVEG